MAAVQSVKLLASASGGSSPSLPIKNMSWYANWQSGHAKDVVNCLWVRLPLRILRCPCGAIGRHAGFRDQMLEVRIFSWALYRDVAQLVAHVIWDHGAAGSRPVIPTVCISAAIGRRGRLKPGFLWVRIPSGAFYKILVCSSMVERPAVNR